MLFRNYECFKAGWLYFVLMFSLILILPDSFSEENGVLEILQLFWLVAGIYYCLTLPLKNLRNWGGEKRPLGIAGAVYFFLLFMREISWGRVFIRINNSFIEYSQMGLYGKLVHPLVGLLIIGALYMLYRAKFWKVLIMIKLPFSSLVLLSLFITFGWMGEKNIIPVFRGQMLEELSEFDAYMMMYHIVCDLGNRLKVTARNQNFDF